MSYSGFSRPKRLLGYLTRGFNMIELGIVIAIVLAVLAGVVFAGLDYFNDARYRRVGDEMQLAIAATRDIAQGGGYPGAASAAGQAVLTNSVAGRVQDSMQSDPAASTGRYIVVGGAGGYPLHVQAGRSAPAFAAGTVGGNLEAHTTRQFMLRIGSVANKPPSELCTVLATRDFLGLLGLQIFPLDVAVDGPALTAEIGATTAAVATSALYTYRGSASGGSTTALNLRERRLYAAEVCDRQETAVLYFLLS